MNILTNIYIKNIFKRYLALTISLVIAAICFNLLLKPINLVAGGTAGLSLVIEHTFEISTNEFIAIVYVICFLASIIFLGKESFAGLLYATLLYPLLVNLTQNISNIIIINYNDPLLIAIFAGILSGISGGLIYKNDFPSSGLGVIAPILHKHFNFSISTTNFIINSIIVILGGYYFGIDMVLYAILLIYINSYISNIIILGISYNKALFIKSEKTEEISKYLYTNYQLKSTLINAHGGYSNKKGQLLLIVIPTSKYNYIKQSIKTIDKNIFYVTCNSYELNHKASQ